MARRRVVLATARAERYLVAINHSLTDKGGGLTRAAFSALGDPIDRDDTPPQAGLQAGLEGRLAAIVGPTLLDMGYELVRVTVLGRDRPTVQVMADRADGALIGVDDCEQISRALGAVLDVADPMPGAWMLEVSSAGIDRPLTRAKDWVRFAGHRARVELDVPVEGRRRATGTVLGADKGTAQLRLDDGGTWDVALANVRRAKLVLTDALIAATAVDKQTN